METPGVAGQLMWLPPVGASGIGLTVMVKLTGVPVQPLAAGVTCMVPVMGAVVKLVAVKADMLPVLPVAKPMPALVFVQV